jgi:hypothetical protein
MIKNYRQIKKKNRPFTPAEQAGMSNLLSNLRKLIEQATGKPSVTSIQPDGDTLSSQPIDGYGEQ